MIIPIIPYTFVPSTKPKTIKEPDCKHSAENKTVVLETYSDDCTWERHYSDGIVERGIKGKDGKYTYSIYKKKPAPTFGYSHPIKTAFKKGLLPNVKKGVYGIPINSENVSIEHGDAVCWGGKTELSNVLLADKKANNKRGNQPIEKFLTKKMLKDYLYQFKDVLNKYVNGNEYMRSVWERFSPRLK